MENVMARGIRPYGPGKFNTMVDSYANSVTLDGGADEEIHLDDDGYYGFVRLNHSVRGAVKDEAEANNDQLTQAEEDFLAKNAAVIFFERSDGIVETDWFEDLEDAEEKWSEIEEDFEGEDEEELEEEEEQD